MRNSLTYDEYVIYHLLFFSFSRSESLCVDIFREHFPEKAKIEVY